jgi:hypothetical protein
VGRPPPPAGAETILALPTRIEPVRNVRSTVVIASVDNVKASGRFDDYLKRIPAKYQQALFETVAASWVPADAVKAHYAACDALGYSAAAQNAMGRRSLERVGETLVGTAFKIAKQAGATPWLVFPQFQRFWMRGYDGGAVAVYKVGPKDARLDLVGFSLCEIPFYRRVLAGWVEGITALFCTRVFVRERPQPDGPHSLSLRAQWV